jgi:hypothetical protein
MNNEGKINLSWKQKCANVLESAFWPKIGAPFHFRISLSGVSSNPWYTVIIHKGDNLVCREDKRSLDDAKKTCESFLKHMHYREGMSEYEIRYGDTRKG